MKHLRNTALGLAAIITIISAMPRTSYAVDAGGIAGGVASCAMGAAIQTAITSAISGFFGGSGGIGGLLGGGGSSIGTAVPVTDSTVISNTSDIKQKASNQEKKAFTLDRLASCAAKQILHQMTADTITWINTGFKGGPAFLTNPKGFFLDAADQITGMLISDSGPLKQLCSPWNIDIRLTIAIEQSLYNSDGFQNRRYECTLSKIINNGIGNATINGKSIQGFVKGDFKQGGWPAFIELTTVPANNPMGAYLQAKSDIYDAVTNRKNAVKEDLARGQGFMSWEKCEKVNYTPSGLGADVDADWDSALGIKNLGNGQAERCSTQTPGSVIANALNVHTNSGVVEAELANDINSVISALSTALINKMLSTGLASLNSGGSGAYNGRTNLVSYADSLRASARSGYTETDGTSQFNVQNGGVTSTLTPAGYYAQAIQSLQTATNNLVIPRDTCKAKTGSAYTTVTTKINDIIDGEITPKIAELEALRQKYSGANFTTADTDTASSMNDDVVGMVKDYNRQAIDFQVACDSTL